MILPSFCRNMFFYCSFFEIHLFLFFDQQQKQKLFNVLFSEKNALFSVTIGCFPAFFT
jgi:hypothetical protein